MDMLPSLKVYAPAKLNLGLEILHKRADGYHEINTVFQKISLYDEILLTPASSGISITTDDPELPTGSSNLAYKAAACLYNHCSISPGLHIHIIKKIPSGAGLGGGSSDAAATLLGLKVLFHLDVNSSRLFNLAETIGADVPFFISPAGTAHATGIGEQLTPLRMQGTLWFLVIFPGISISTAWAYDTYSKYNLLTKTGKNIIVKNYINSITSVTPLLVNDFEDVVIPEHSEIETIKTNLLKAGAAGSLLSGSGSSVFGVFATKQAAETALSKLHLQPSHKVFIVHSL